MIPAFWDASALVPLCVLQEPSTAVTRLSSQYEIVVWWGTPVEVQSACQRLSRMGHLLPQDHEAARIRLQDLRLRWRELRPTIALRSQAELFLQSYPLKAADALQLAAAWTWSSGTPGDHLFISADTQLSAAAARKVGFQIASV